MFPLPRFVEVTDTELFFTPTVVPVTLRVMMQYEPTLAPDRLTVDAPATAVIVGLPQSDMFTSGGVETTNPVGKVSVNATPVRNPVSLGLFITKLRPVLPPTAIVAALNDFAIMGGAFCPVAGSRNKPARDATKVL